MFLAYFFRPVYPTEETEGEDDDVEDEAELTLEKVEEEMLEGYDEDEEEENVLHLDDLRDLTVNEEDIQKPENILHSTTTSEEWRLELERVLPQLKVTIKPGKTISKLYFWAL